MWFLSLIPEQRETKTVWNHLHVCALHLGADANYMIVTFAKEEKLKPELAQIIPMNKEN